MDLATSPSKSLRVPTADVGMPAASTGLVNGSLNPFMISETLSEASKHSLISCSN